MNKSGIQPINCNVLVLPDTVEEKKGNIYLPDEVKMKDQHAQMAGVLIAASDDAFMTPEGDYSWDWETGKRVTFARYAGKKITGKDGVEYWMMKDVDVTGYEIEGLR